MCLVKCSLPSHNLSVPNKVPDSTIILAPRLLARPHRLHGDILRIIWEIEPLHPSPKRAPFHGPRKPVVVRVLGPDERRPVCLDRGV